MEASLQKFRKRARKAMVTICLSLCDNQLSLVRTAETARAAWLKLESYYEIKSLANKLFPHKRYFTACMVESASMMVHINKMRSLAKQLAAVGAEFIIIALYVDDMLLAYNSTKLLQNEKEALQ